MKASLEGVEAEDSQCRIALTGSGTLYAWGLAENGRLGLVRSEICCRCYCVVPVAYFVMLCVMQRATSRTRSCFSQAMTALDKRATSSYRSRRSCPRCCSRRSPTFLAARVTPLLSPVRCVGSNGFQ